MTSSRDALFSRLKDTLDQRHNPTVRYSGADQRMREAAPRVLPERAQTQGPTQTAMFIAEAERADAHVMQVKALADLPATLKLILMRDAITAIKIAPDDRLKALDWAGQCRNIDVAFGRGAGTDLVGLSFAYAGVAETGTLVMCSSPTTPTTLNFLPDVHMVVLRQTDICANYEHVWARLRHDSTGDKPVLPRTVNWITGPSRTADIEQTLLLGAHGPRKLMIFVIDGET